MQSAVVSTDQAVQSFLAGRALSIIEGAWKHEANAFELVISRNSFDIARGYDYVGIITHTDDASWTKGDVKMLLRSTQSPLIFEGILIASNHARQEMTFVVESQNLVQGSFESNNGDMFYMRIRRMSSPLAARADPLGQQY